MTVYTVVKSNTSGVVRANIKAETPLEATKKAFKAVSYRPRCNDKCNNIRIEDENGNTVAHYHRNWFGSGKWKMGDY